MCPDCQIVCWQQPLVLEWDDCCCTSWSVSAVSCMPASVLHWLRSQQETEWMNWTKIVIFFSFHLNWVWVCKQYMSVVKGRFGTILNAQHEMLPFVDIQMSSDASIEWTGAPSQCGFGFTVGLFPQLSDMALLWQNEICREDMYRMERNLSNSRCV